MAEMGPALSETLAAHHAEIEAEARERKERISEYAHLLAEGESTRGFRYPYAKDHSAFVELGNADRRDRGLHDIPYRRDTDEYVATEFLLDGDWHTIPEIHEAIRARRGFTFKPQIPNLLSRLSIYDQTLKLEKRSGSPVAYRIVQVEAAVTS